MVLEDWGADLVAVCRHVHKCHARVLIPNGKKLTDKQRREHVRKTWRTDGVTD